MIARRALKLLYTPVTLRFHLPASSHETNWTVTLINGKRRQAITQIIGP